MAAPLLKIDQLSTWLSLQGGVVRAVDGLSLELFQGETFALLGESGCGKSMTALSIMRLLPDGGSITGGHIWFNTTDLLTLPEIEMRSFRGGHLGMIFQEPMLSLNPVMTIGNQVAEVLDRHTDLPREAAVRRTVELLDAVGIPDALRRYGEYPFQLSGGMKQRVMIAMALACEPEILIADEPTTALDVTIQAQVLDLLRQYQLSTRMAILLITHDLGVVAEMAHRVAVMYAGEVVEKASRDRFFRSPAHPYSQKLFASLPNRNKRGQALAVIKGHVPPLTGRFKGCRFADRCDFAWDLCHHRIPPWVEAAADHLVRCHLAGKGIKSETEGSEKRPEKDPGAFVSEAREWTRPIHLTPGPDPALLTVEGLQVHFPIRKGLLKRLKGSVKAVDGVSFSIPPGRTLALVGESGCGKTTVGKGLLRLIPFTAGSVRFQDKILTDLSAAELRPLRRDFQIIFQDPFASLNPRMRVVDIIEEGMTALGVGTGHDDRQEHIEGLLREVGLTEDIKYRYPHEFSGGQRQRLAIARALSVDPKLIICDEPTSALDVSVQAQILNLLKKLQDRYRLAYLFISHNISVVEFLAHEVAVMYLGRIIERGTVTEIFGQPRHPYTRALWAAVPVIDPESRREVIRLPGELPSPVNPPRGCYFHPRCPEVMAPCREIYPPQSVFSPSHRVHCHMYR